MYAYCANNPISNTDSTGCLLDFILDMIFLVWGIVEFVLNPTWENAGWLALDLAFAIVPFATGSGIIKAGTKISKMADLAATANKLDKLKDGGKAIAIIGQGMDRVYSVNKAIGGLTYDGLKICNKLAQHGKAGKAIAEILGKGQNMGWLLNKLRHGYDILDLGWDLRKVGEGIDKMLLSGYLWENFVLTLWELRNVFKLFQLED